MNAVDLFKRSAYKEILLNIAEKANNIILLLWPVSVAFNPLKKNKKQSLV